jgi:hypothetical protein
VRRPACQRITGAEEAQLCNIGAWSSPCASDASFRFCAAGNVTLVKSSEPRCSFPFPLSWPTSTVQAPAREAREDEKDRTTPLTVSHSLAARSNDQIAITPVNAAMVVQRLKTIPHENPRYSTNSDAAPPPPVCHQTRPAITKARRACCEPSRSTAHAAAAASSLPMRSVVTSQHWAPSFFVLEAGKDVSPVVACIQWLAYCGIDLPCSKSPHRFIVILLLSNSPSYSMPAFLTFSPLVFRVSPQLKSSNFQ